MHEGIEKHISPELGRSTLEIHVPNQFAEKLRNADDIIAGLFGRHREQRIIALGTAYVEAKIQSPELHLPQQRNQLPAFLDAHPEANLYAGGSVPNILTSFARISGHPNVRLFCCVGNDDRGRFFIESIDQRLGKPQVSRQGPTGVAVGVYSKGLTEFLDFYGAADDVTVSRRELSKAKTQLFISDIDFMSVPRTLRQVQRVIRATKRDNGIFALSLGHVGYYPSASDQKHIQEVLSPFYRTPNLVFGNEHEVHYLTGQKDLYDAMTIAFLESELVVATKAEKGALIRLDGEIFSVPAISIEPEDIIDAVGAGDTFMGVALAILMRTPYALRNRDNVTQAMQIANYAASLVIKSMYSQLTDEMGQQVLNYERSINDEKS
ncbi:hypothetical protein A3B42_02425 [Candidatus Daviesbacteria bacterium RIFCSPLOWO2_01_FULL_38_10]|nr:MAG: hypothetical protein A3D02_03250 [Candidatus Daviesbacteria bacterium RIFCSPHIGHO2_02_FULL_39_41]OGE27844.1 MAG: hypothetical protein A2772_01910 [Candidatus Daviesbacteria bacterium RIFCSPHIGHO2_01_FULL_38_8b]OGE39595.1 MAG: hypothetical protein A3B42_02425 [Candidatus Daviesbacteria bacterium RIFCSPLOWO2_01_FULL_38_10]OGE45448.1 MAG: hypothetical protein A3E67_00115 [Candidatus Daviesbacteria bacterium RIFCSPHIGHO2_12_FULL_38_25]OGE68760.1 MAG: hypothetical protein A3H81_06130 [Candid